MRFAFVMSLLVGCAHHTVSWVESGEALLGGEVVSLSVRSDDVACADVEQSLREDLVHRGLVVRDVAPVILELSRCELEVESQVDLRVDHPMFNESQGADGLRAVQVSGEGRAELAVLGMGQEPLVLVARSQAEDDAGWRQKPDDALARQIGLVHGLADMLAEDLAQQLHPVEVQRRRRTFRQAEPGSAEAVLNEAVAAEMSGDLERALDLAREAYVRMPTWWALDYVDDLERRANRDVGIVQSFGTH